MQPKSSISKSSNGNGNGNENRDGSSSSSRGTCAGANWKVTGRGQAAAARRGLQLNNSKESRPAEDCQGQSDDCEAGPAIMNRGQSAEATTLEAQGLLGDRAFGADATKVTDTGQGLARERSCAIESSSGGSKSTNINTDTNNNSNGNNNNFRIVSSATKQVGDNHLLDAELAVVRQQQEQQQQQRQWRQDKLLEDDDRSRSGGELVNDSIRKQLSALAIDSDRTVSDSGFVGLEKPTAPSAFRDQSQQQHRQAAAESSSSAAAVAETEAAAAAAAAYQSGGASTIVSRKTIGQAAGPAGSDTLGCDDDDLFRADGAAKRRSSLDGEHVLASFSNGQRHNQQHPQKHQHQYQYQSRRQQSSFEQNQPPIELTSNSCGDSSAGYGGQLVDDTKQQQQRHQRIKVTLSKPKQEPRRRSLGESQDTEVEAKLAEFYTINPSLQSKQKQKQKQKQRHQQQQDDDDEEEEGEKQNSTITITEQILVQDESSTTTPILVDEICCRHSISTPAVNGTLAAEAAAEAAATLISPIDSQLQSELQSQLHTQPQTQLQTQPQLQQNDSRGEHRGERVKRTAQTQQNGAGSQPLAAATTIGATKLSRSEQEDLLRRIALQRRRNLNGGGEPVFNNDSTSNGAGRQQQIAAASKQTTPAASNIGGSGASAIRQAKPVAARQWAQQSISKSILNTKRQSQADNNSGELNLLDSDFLIPSQPSVTRSSAVSKTVAQKQQQQQQQKQQLLSAANGPSGACQQQQQKNCPKQLAIYINGKIRSNSIFCSRSVSSNSFSSILKGFHSSGSDQEQPQRASSKPASDCPLSSGRKQLVVPNNRPIEGNKSQQKQVEKDKAKENSTFGLQQAKVKPIERENDDTDQDDVDNSSTRGKSKSKSKIRRKKQARKRRRESRHLVRRSIVPGDHTSSLVTFWQNFNLNRRNLFSSSSGITKCGIESGVADRGSGDKGGRDSACGQSDLEQGQCVQESDENFGKDQEQEQDRDRDRDRDRNRELEREKQALEQEQSKSYKLNPSSMFLRKAMRYYRLWIYSANLTILSGTIIFVLSTLYVTSDYRMKLIISPPSAPSSHYLSSLSSSSPLITDGQQVNHPSSPPPASDQQAISNTDNPDPFGTIAPPAPRAKDYLANKSSNSNSGAGGDDAFVATTTSKQQQHHEFTISLNEPTMLVAYVIIALQLGLLQAIGCFGAIRTKERLIQAFWYIILLLVLFDVVFLFYWLQRYNFMLKSLQTEMTFRLQHRYGRRQAPTLVMLNNNGSSSNGQNNSSSSNLSSSIINGDSDSELNININRNSNGEQDYGQRPAHERSGTSLPGAGAIGAQFDEIFTEIFDRIQAESQCCGMRNSADYKRAKWREVKLIELQARLDKQRVGADAIEMNKHNDDGDYYERQQLIELLHQVPLVPASCCRRPKAGAAAAETGSTTVNREWPPPGGVLAADEDPKKGSVISAPYPDDSELPRKLRVPAWSPSMVVDDQFIVPSSAPSSSLWAPYWTSSESKDDNNDDKNGQDADSQDLTIKSRDEQDKLELGDVLDSNGGGGGRQSEESPTLADVIDRRWTGRRWPAKAAKMRDEVGQGQQAEDKVGKVGEEIPLTESDNSYGNGNSNPTIDELGDAGSGYDNNKIYNRLKAKQRHYGLDPTTAGAGLQKFVATDQAGLAGGEVKQLVSGGRSKRDASDDIGWAVEARLDAHDRVLARLIELIDLSSSPNGTYNASASRLAAPMWPVDDVDSDADNNVDIDVGDDADDYAGDKDDEDEPSDSGPEMQNSIRQEVLPARQIGRKVRKVAIGRQLNKLRQVLFERPESSAGRNTFRWPNELHLSYEQFKLIEAFILNEMSMLSNGGEEARNDLQAPQGRIVVGPKEKVISRRSIERNQQQEQQQQLPHHLRAEEKEKSLAQRRRHARQLKLIRELISQDEELGGPSCLPRSHYDETRIYTRGCQHTIRAWLQSSANTLFVMGFCVLTVLKFCSLILLRLEIREMIHKIRVLKGMATEYNALQDLEPYLPRPSICDHVAELTPAGVTTALSGVTGGAGGPTSCSSLVAAGSGANNVATASSGGGVTVSSNINSSGHSPTHTGGGGQAPRRLGGSFSEAVAAATAVAHQQRLAVAEAQQQQQQQQHLQHFNHHLHQRQLHHHHHQHYGRAGSLINCARAVSTKTIGGFYGGTTGGGGGRLALSACPSAGTMLTAPISGCSRTSRINSATICPCVSSSLSVAHFGQAASALHHYHQQASSLRSDLFPAAYSMPRRHTAISVCPAAAAAAAAAAAKAATSAGGGAATNLGGGSSCSQQYLMVRRGTYSPAANSMTSGLPGATGQGGQGGGGNTLVAGATRLQAPGGTVDVDNLLHAQNLNYLSQHRHSAYAGTIQAPSSLLSGGGGGSDLSNASSRRTSRAYAGDETNWRSASQQEDEEQNGVESKINNNNNDGNRREKEMEESGLKSGRQQQQQVQRPTKQEQQQQQQRQLLSLEPGGANPPPFVRQSSGGAQSAVNFSLDITPPNLTESRRSIH